MSRISNIDIDKVYVGVVQPLTDDINPAKIYVNIPELFMFANVKTASLKNSVLVDNPFSNRLIKNKQGDSFHYYGSYFPLKPGTEVLIKFRTDDINSGYIIDIGSSNKTVPIQAGKETTFLIAETSKSRVYIDDYNNRYHVTIGNGNSDFFMDDKGIVLQMSETVGVEPIVKSYFEINKDGLVFKLGEKELLFNDTGFSIKLGGETKTIFSLTEKGVVLGAEEYLNISSFGNTNIYSAKNSYIQSDGDLNLKGNVTKVTGNQRASLNSAVVHVRGWLDTHIKAGMNLKLESLVKLDIQSIIKNELVVGVSNYFSSLDNKTIITEGKSSMLSASSITTIIEDGLRLKDMGLSTNVVQNISSVSQATMLGTMGTFMGLTTLFSLDNVGTAVASAVINDNSVGDSASNALSISGGLLSGIFKTPIDKKNYINKLNKLHNLSKDREAEFTVESSLFKL